MYGQQATGYRQREGWARARREAPTENEPGRCQVCGKPIEDNGTPFCPLCDALILLDWWPGWQGRIFDPAWKRKEEMLQKPRRGKFDTH